MKILHDYVVIDIETSGLHPDNGDRITVVSALKVLKNQIEDQFFSFINTGIQLDPVVEEITGISNLVLKDAPSSNAVFPQLLSFIGDLPIVTHNAEFSKRFLENEFHLLNLNSSMMLNDSLARAREVFPDESCTIKALLERLNLRRQNIDSFYLSDVKNIYQIYEAIKHLS